MDSERKSSRSATVLFLAGIMGALLACGCDGYMAMQGRVYGSLPANPTDVSFAVVDNIDRLPPSDLTPLKGAEITVEPWSPEERASVNAPELFILRGRTDESGYFTVEHIARPGKYEATLTVRQAGCQPLQKTFTHARFRHRAIVVLVPATSPEGKP